MKNANKRKNRARRIGAVKGRRAGPHSRRNNRSGKRKKLHPRGLRPFHGRRSSVAHWILRRKQKKKLSLVCIKFNDHIYYYGTVFRSVQQIGISGLGLPGKAGAALSGPGTDTSLREGRSRWYTAGL